MHHEAYIIVDMSFTNLPKHPQQLCRKEHGYCSYINQVSNTTDCWTIQSFHIFEEFILINGFDDQLVVSLFNVLPSSEGQTPERPYETKISYTKEGLYYFVNPFPKFSLFALCFVLFYNDFLFFVSQNFMNLLSYNSIMFQFIF